MLRVARCRLEAGNKPRNEVVQLSKPVSIKPKAIHESDVSNCLSFFVSLCVCLFLWLCLYRISTFVKFNKTVVFCKGVGTAAATEVLAPAVLKPQERSIFSPPQ